MRILVVEDEAEMALLLAARLSAAGFLADRVACCGDALHAAALHPYALMLLDRRLPDGDGAAMVPALRRARPGVPIILVSALDGVADRIKGLDAGADDYLTKPFDGDELLARIRAALRRPGGTAPPPVVCGGLVFDSGQREASAGGRAIRLRRRELAILEALMLRAGRVVARERLVEACFGLDDIVQPVTLESHVSRLRAKLAAGAGVLIHPVRGVGYLLDAG
jgi:two-component system OmpR family response regulator